MHESAEPTTYLMDASFDRRNRNAFVPAVTNYVETLPIGDEPLQVQATLSYMFSHSNDSYHYNKYVGDKVDSVASNLRHCGAPYQVLSHTLTPNKKEYLLTLKLKPLELIDLVGCSHG